MLIDFERDIREHVLASLPHNPVDRPALVLESASTLLIRYFNWTSRFVEPQPRQVRRSAAVVSGLQALDPEQRAALNLLFGKFELGADITPHLSKGIRIGAELPRPGRKDRRRDLDLLLNDWGIHHLHLSTKQGADGFVVRSGPLLFAAFKPHAVYLIDILEHRVDPWTKQALLETMVREWPEAGLLLEVKGVLPSGTSLTDQQRRQLRDVNMNSALEIDGRIYKPNLGLLANGIALLSGVKAMKALKLAGNAEKQISSKAGPLWNTITTSQIAFPDDAVFEFRFLEAGYGIIEIKTGTMFEL